MGWAVNTRWYSVHIPEKVMCAVRRKLLPCDWPFMRSPAQRLHSADETRKSSQRKPLCQSGLSAVTTVAVTARGNTS